MIKQEITRIIVRDLGKLREEIGLYKEENSLWLLKDGISNSGGNLCLHLVGNLKHFIGATLGNTGYVRQRDLEFSSKNIPRADLIAALDETMQIVQQTLDGMQDEDLSKSFPLEKHGEIVRTDFMLLHLITHLDYHLGQINYHRRLLEG